MFDLHFYAKSIKIAEILELDTHRTVNDFL